MTVPVTCAEELSGISFSWTKKIVVVGDGPHVGLTENCPEEERLSPANILEAVMVKCVARARNLGGNPGTCRARCLWELREPVSGFTYLRVAPILPVPLILLPWSSQAFHIRFPPVRVLHRSVQQTTAPVVCLEKLGAILFWIVRPSQWLQDGMGSKVSLVTLGTIGKFSILGALAFGALVFGTFALAALVLGMLTAGALLVHALRLGGLLLETRSIALNLLWHGMRRCCCRVSGVAGIAVFEAATEHRVKLVHRSQESHKCRKNNDIAWHRRCPSKVNFFFCDRN
mmetsp:Transcript_27441/g.63914  ORF Transcript_27441/g.63914 Transcript_27441/m.63914 type:complete len:286 (-) Transcript_27441:10-867(-)